MAILGSVLGAAYRLEISGALGALPVEQRAAAGESIEATFAAAQRASDQAASLIGSAKDSFVAAMHLSSLCAAIVALVGAAVHADGQSRRGPLPKARLGTVRHGDGVRVQSGRDSRTHDLHDQTAAARLLENLVETWGCAATCSSRPVRR